ncbi:MAG: glycosyltransferase family 9 protein, partial [Endomicrobia bacterium]|nr:glycosyltransferase family 9 protein [Endomicrobiia bacterium]
ALKEIRKTEYDLAIDLQGLMRSAWLARFSKAKVKLGVPGMKEGSGMLIKEVYPQNANMNATLRNLEPVRYLTDKKFTPEANIKIDDSAIREAEGLLSENGVTGDFISLLPFARGKNKNWSVENYLKLIDLIKSKYPQLQIAVLGSSGDYGKLKAIDLCGKTDIRQLVAVLSKSVLAIGADTGPMHLASVLNTASVFIFGASDINETAPYIGRFSLLINKENPVDIDKVSPQQVFEEAEKWLKMEA